jgi:hypothetical protein
VQTTESAYPIEGERKLTVRRNFGLILLFFEFAALGFALLLTRLESPYGRYVTQPLDACGTRISLLVPRGWHLRFSPVKPLTATIAWLEFDPPEPALWMPNWARQWMHIRRENGGLYIAYERTYSGSFGQDIGPIVSRGRYSSTRSRAVPGIGSWTATYMRDNRSAFESTYGDILDSIRLH